MFCAGGVIGLFEQTPEQAAAGKGAIEMYQVNCDSWLMILVAVAW
jgi:hypothetical protein